MVGKQYRILEQLGKGAFGTVYRAEVLAAGDFRKQVALKVLDYKGEAPEEIALRFRDEARILGLVRHRAIVGVDSLAELQTGWAVVMEYVDGINISVVVKYGLPPARVCVGIVEEVASALHAAFSTPSDVTGEPLKLVHRDIKPANIRLTTQGEVKVLDFGVARAEFDSREARTQAMRFGSLRYMAPESFDGIEGHPTDVFALGIVFAELLSGQRLEEPPKNPERYPAFVEQVRGLVVGRMGPLLVAEHLDQVLALLERMIAFEPGTRPNAREIERAARELASRLPSASLRDWAEDNVPQLADQVARKKANTKGEGMSTAILVEKSNSNAFDLPTAMGRSAVLPGAGVSAGEAETQALPRAQAAEDTGTRPSATSAEFTGARGAVAVGASAAVGAGIAVLLLAALAAGGVWFAWDRFGPESTVADVAEVMEPAPAPVAVPAPVEAVAAVPPVPVAAPEPVASPGVSASVGKPTPSPKSAPKEIVAEPSGATVAIEGDAAAVELMSEAGSFPAGQVPAGSYRIMADFGDGAKVQAGTVTVRDGESVAIRCYSVMLKCSKAK